MGWLYCEPTREALVKRLTSPANFGPVYKLVDHSHKGNDLWVLVQDKDDPEDRTIIHCRLSGTRGDGHPPDIRWGYKDVAESCGPVHVGCPQRLLDQSTCDEPWAVRWRQRCVEAREHDKRRRAFIAGLKPGDKFRCHGQTVTFAKPSPPYLKRYVLGYVDGELYKWPKARVQMPPEPPPAPEPQAPAAEPVQLSLAA